MPRLPLLLAALLAVVTALPVQTGDTRGQAQAPFADDALAAVLRKGAGPRGGCTAVLVAPDAVLTAAHCARTGRGAFFTDWTAGAFTHRREGIAGRRPALEPLTAHQWHTDQIRVTLDAPLTDRAPLPVGPPPAVGDTVTVLSYRSGGTRPQRATCTVLRRPGTEIVLDCPARSGMSGAPILRDTPRGPELAGLLTNRIGPDRALGTAIATDLTPSRRAPDRP